MTVSTFWYQPANPSILTLVQALNKKSKSWNFLLLYIIIKDTNCLIIQKSKY